MGQGPRPDLLLEEMQEREEREARDVAQNAHPALNQDSSAPTRPMVWNEEDSFASRVEDIPKPTKKDLLAMIIAMLELMLPIALLFVAIFAGAIFLLQKVWLHG